MCYTLQLLLFASPHLPLLTAAIRSYPQLHPHRESNYFLSNSQERKEKVWAFIYITACKNIGFRKLHMSCYPFEKFPRQLEVPGCSPEDFHGSFALMPHLISHSPSPSGSVPLTCWEIIPNTFMSLHNLFFEQQLYMVVGRVFCVSVCLIRWHPGQQA